MRGVVILALSAALLASCATQKAWQATGGSRADGVVRLSYEHGALEVPHLDEQQAVSVATARCKVWGYDGAEAFGGETRTCSYMSGYSCARFIVTKEYQCTGGGRPGMGVQNVEM